MKDRLACRVAALGLLAAVLLLGACAPAWAAAQRLALVIGNARLANQVVLPSAARDVQTVSAALREAGFLVMQREDLGAEALRANLDEFRSRLAAGGSGNVGLIYITTLGAQVDGQTMLLMRDTRLPDDDNAEPARVAAAVQRDAVELVEVLHALTGGSGARALLLDAAWRHPLLDKLPQPGLAEPRLPQGVVALFGQPLGQTQPRPDNTSPAASTLARALALELATPGLRTQPALEKLRQGLSPASGAAPWLGGATDARETLAEARGVALPAPMAAAPSADLRTRPAGGERGERPVFEPRRNPFGHAEGDALSFRITDLARDEVVATSTQFIDTVGANGSLSANGGELLLDAEGRITRHKRRDGSVASYSPAQALWWAAPQSGQKREVAFTESIERSDGARVLATWLGQTEVGALRTLELPAGRFDALPLVSRGTIVEAAAGAAPSTRNFVHTAWFAPKLGQPVAIEIEETAADGKAVRRERIELTHAQTARDK